MSSLSTYTLRDKYMKSTLNTQLRSNLIAEAICKVDRSDLKRIQNPYITQVTATAQNVAGTYTPTDLTTTDDALTVDKEFIYGTHVYDFEELTSNFNLFADFAEDITYSVSFGVDKYVVNMLAKDGTGTYTTPAGGFTTAANIPVICSNLLSKVGGYQSSQSNGYFLVIENTDMVGFAQAQVASGFSYADAALRNGFMTNYMGIDIYVIRTGTFVTATYAGTAFTNASKRVFGVKGVATYASPRGIRYQERGVTGKTGMEMSIACLCGFKLWTPNAGLVVSITLA